MLLKLSLCHLYHLYIFMFYHTTVSPHLSNTSRRTLKTSGPLLKECKPGAPNNPTTECTPSLAQASPLFSTMYLRHPLQRISEMMFANAPPSEGLFFGKSLDVQTLPVSFDRNYTEPRECSQKNR